jgi:biopolymer transport protein ExbD
MAKVIKTIILSLAFLTTLVHSEVQLLILTVSIENDHLGIWGGGGHLPKLFYMEGTANLWALHKESEEDFGKIKMSVYSKSDSAYLDSNNEFITELSAVKPGSIVTTLSENSARTLACGQSGAGIEDICSNGKLAVSLRPLSVYDELARYLIMIHGRFLDDPTVNEISILIGDYADLLVTFNKVINIIDRAKAAGFYKIRIIPFYSEDGDKDVAFAKAAKIIDMAKKAGYHINEIDESEIRVLGNTKKSSK